MKHFLGYLTNHLLQCDCLLSGFMTMTVCVSVCVHHVSGNVCTCFVSADPLLHLQYLSVFLHMVSGRGSVRKSLTSAWPKFVVSSYVSK